MKLRTCILFTFVILLILPLAHAAEIKGDDTVIIPRNEQINDDVYAAGAVLILEGTVNGDFVAAGGTVKITGEVNDDIMAAGGTINIDGVANDDVRVAGGTIIIDSDVKGDVIAAGGTMEIYGDVDGDVIVAGGMILINGDVGGNLNATGGQVILGGKFGGDVSITAEEIELLPTADIQGNLVYESEKPAKIGEGANVDGDITHNIPKDAANKTAGYLLAVFMSFIAMLIVGLLAVRFYPNASTKAIGAVSSAPWKSLGVGLASIVLIPILALLLMITLVGIPLGMIIVAVYMIGIYLSYIFSALALGKNILERYRSKGGSSLSWSLLTGLVVLTIITNIPVIGWLAGIFAVLFGLGALLITEIGIYKESRNEKIV